MISLAYKISYCLSANHNLKLRSVNCTVLHFLHRCYTFCTGVTLFALVLHFLHWCYTFCTGVTLFALVLHLNCIALSQSESVNFFMCIHTLMCIIRPRKQRWTILSQCRPEITYYIAASVRHFLSLPPGARFLIESSGNSSDTKSHF